MCRGDAPVLAQRYKRQSAAAHPYSSIYDLKLRAFKPFCDALADVDNPSFVAFDALMTTACAAKRPNYSRYHTSFASSVWKLLSSTNYIEMNDLVFSFENTSVCRQMQGTNLTEQQARLMASPSIGRRPDTGQAEAPAQARAMGKFTHIGLDIPKYLLLITTPRKTSSHSFDYEKKQRPPRAVSS